MTRLDSRGVVGHASDRATGGSKQAALEAAPLEGFFASRLPTKMTYYPPLKSCLLSADESNLNPFAMLEAIRNSRTFKKKRFIIII